MSEIFKPHGPKQEEAIFSEAPILLVASGTQFGKTVVGALRMKMAIHRHSSPDDAFLITSPTYKILNQSTLPPFLKLMAGCGEYSKHEAVFTTRWGSKIYLRTGTDPDSVVGITNVRHIWCDEAGKYGLYFFENISARANFCGCPIDLTTSPYSLNWVYKDLIKPHLAGKRPDVHLVQAASWENPYHSLADPKRREEKRASMDERRFNMLFGGRWDRMEGLVYDCWDDAINYVEPFSLPQGTRFYAGIDWGYNPDPFVITVRAITPDGRHFGVSEFCKTRLTLPDQIEVAKQKKSVFNIIKFFADPSQPGAIEEFNRNGLPCVGADNDIRTGIDLHYSLIKTRRYKEFLGACPYAADERELYHYPDEPDLGPDDNQKTMVPVDKDNHVMDAQRYVSIMTYRLTERHEPKSPVVPGDTGRKKSYQELTRVKGSNRTENWS